MFIAMNRFKVLKGEEKAFEEVWLSRDTRLGEVTGFVEFHLLRGPEREDHTLCSPTRFGSAGSCSPLGPNPSSSARRIGARAPTNPSISGIRNSRVSRLFGRSRIRACAAKHARETNSRGFGGGPGGNWGFYFLGAFRDCSAQQVRVLTVYRGRPCLVDIGLASPI